MVRVIALRRIVFSTAAVIAIAATRGTHANALAMPAAEDGEPIPGRVNAGGELTEKPVETTEKPMETTTPPTTPTPITTPTATRPTPTTTPTATTPTATTLTPTTTPTATMPTPTTPPTTPPQPTPEATVASSTTSPPKTTETPAASSGLTSTPQPSIDEGRRPTTSPEVTTPTPAPTRSSGNSENVGSPTPVPPAPTTTGPWWVSGPTATSGSPWWNPPPAATTGSPWWDSHPPSISPSPTSTGSSAPTPTPTSTPKPTPTPKQTPKPTLTAVASPTPTPTPKKPSSGWGPIANSIGDAIDDVLHPTTKPPTTTVVPTKTTVKPRENGADDFREDDDTPTPTTKKPTTTPTPTTKKPSSGWDPIGDIIDNIFNPSPTPTTTTKAPTKTTVKPTPSRVDPGVDENTDNEAAFTPTPTTKKPSSGWDPIGDIIDNILHPSPKPTTTTRAPIKTTVKPTPTRVDPGEEDEEDNVGAVTPKPTTKKPTTTPTSTPTTKKPTTTISNSPTPTTKKTSTVLPPTTTPARTPIQIVLPGESLPPTTAPVDTIDTGVRVIAQSTGDKPEAGAPATAKETNTDITFTNDTQSVTYKKYERGDDQGQQDSQEASTATGSSSGGSSTSPSGGNVVIGGRQRKHVAPGADVEVSVMAQQTQDAMRFSNYGFTVITAVLLMFYHTLALYSPDWLPSRRGSDTMSSWLTPNSWELLVVVSFYQHLGSLSMLELTKAPYFVLDFTDSFSWTNFNLYSMGDSGIARRLEYVILTGMVAYADRLGVAEGQLLAYTTRFFFVVVALLLVCFFAVMMVTRYRARQQEIDSIAKVESQRGNNDDNKNTEKREFALCFIGLATAFWLLSVFPLTASSSYELYMQIKYTVSGDLTIVLFNLVFIVLGGLALLVKRVQMIRTEDAMEFRHVALLGTLYLAMKRAARYFFVVFTIFQLLTGFLVGMVHETPNQLIALLLVHGLFLIAVGGLRPFYEPLANIAVVGLVVLRMVNLLFATCFQTMSDMATSTRGNIANALVIINFLVILAIFFRQFLVFIYVLRMWSSDSHHHKEEFESSRSYDVGDNLQSVIGSDDSHHIELHSTRRGGRHSDRFIETSPTPRGIGGALAAPFGGSQLQQQRPQVAMPTPCDGGDSPVPNLAHRPEKPAFRDYY